MSRSANLKNICEALRKQGIDLVLIRYDGSGDSGQIEGTTYYKTLKEDPAEILSDLESFIEGLSYDAYPEKRLSQDGLDVFEGVEAVDEAAEVVYIGSNYRREVEAPAVLSLENAIERFVYDNIPTPGWEINEGALGVCFINARQGTSGFDHADRTSDVNVSRSRIDSEG